MKKLVKVLSFLTMFGLLFVIFPNKVEAAKDTQLPKGVLVTDENGISLTKSEGYFFNVTNLFPGDTIKRELEIRNERSEAIGIDIDIVPISYSGPINLIKKTDMKWTYEDKVIFEGNLVNQDKKVYEKGSSIQLGKLPANSVKKIEIELYVNPEIPIKDLLNAESEAVVRWDVKASADEIKKPTVKPLEKITLNKGLLPHTGEKIQALLTILAMLSILLVIIMYKKLYIKTDTQ